jgi:hypothetical protein
VAGVLVQLDRWWGRRDPAQRQVLIEHRDGELGGEYREVVMDANEGSPAIVAVWADYPGGQFRLPEPLAVYVALKAQER